MRSLLYTFLYLIRPAKRAIVVTGPTASGKSGYAKNLAREINGELVSCDSRQMYREIEIFSGAHSDIKESHDDVVTHKGSVPYHLLAYKSLSEAYSVTDFVNDALEKITEIQKRGKTPVIVGGTAYWAQALMYEADFPSVSVNDVFRETLHGETTPALYERLQTLDPRRAKTMDPHNRKRLIRALEIVDALGAVPAQSRKLRKGLYFKLIYVAPENQQIKENIRKNIEVRMKQGLLKEAEYVSQIFPQHVLQEVGLGYKHVQDLLDGNITESEFRELMLREEYQYAKRQKTFCKKLFKNFVGFKEMI